MKQIKVLCVITTAFVNGGGLTAVAMNYYREIMKMADSDIAMDFVSSNEIMPDLKNEISKYGSRYFQLSNRKKKIFHYIFELVKLLKTEKYDIIHVHGNSATCAFELIPAMIMGVRIRIAHSHNSSTQYPLLDKILRPLFYLSYTDGVACSKKAGYWMFGKKSYKILNNAIDTNKFEFNENSRKKIRNFIGIKEDTFVVGHVGKMYTDQKNQLYLMDIISETVKKGLDILFVCVGDGQYRKKIEEKARLLGISDKVLFVGFHTNIYEWMQAFDLFVFPSKWEGLPLVLIEAQASGLYCIASSEISSEAKVTNNIEFIGIENHDVLKWASAIYDKYNSHKKTNREEQSKEAKISIKNNKYDITENSKELLELYKKK